MVVYELLCFAFPGMSLCLFRASVVSLDDSQSQSDYTVHTFLRHCSWLAIAPTAQFAAERDFDLRTEET
jgi:hypothetical protein